MKIKNLQFTSPTVLNFEFDITSPVCVLYGTNSELALDLIRELLGDCASMTDPDSCDDGRFVIHSDIGMDGKDYSVCYIRNADYMGDNRIAATVIFKKIRKKKPSPILMILISACLGMLIYSI